MITHAEQCTHLREKLARTRLALQSANATAERWQQVARETLAVLDAADAEVVRLRADVEYLRSQLRMER